MMLFPIIVSFLVLSAGGLRIVAKCRLRCLPMLSIPFVGGALWMCFLDDSGRHPEALLYAYQAQFVIGALTMVGLIVDQAACSDLILALLVISASRNDEGKPSLFQVLYPGRRVLEAPVIGRFAASILATLAFVFGFS